MFFSNYPSFGFHHCSARIISNNLSCRWIEAVFTLHLRSKDKTPSLHAGHHTNLTKIRYTFFFSHLRRVEHFMWESKLVSFFVFLVEIHFQLDLFPTQPPPPQNSGLAMTLFDCKRSLTVATRPRARCHRWINGHLVVKNMCASHFLSMLVLLVGWLVGCSTCLHFLWTFYQVI